MTLSPERRAERLAHLVCVAQTLIREGGDAGFSMNQLAARAGVSPATPYNLIGTRADVLRCVVRAEFSGFVARLSARPVLSPLARLIDATVQVVEHYVIDQPFYRGLYRASTGPESSDTHAQMLQEGRLLWRGLVEDCLAAGDFAPGTRMAPLTDHLLRVISATSMAWIANDWDHRQFSMEMEHSILLSLCGITRSAVQSGLQVRILVLQEQLFSMASSGGEANMTVEAAAPVLA